MLATPGADRMYVTETEWKQVVVSYLAKSQVVVLQPSKAEGVRWEIQQVFAKYPRNRILLSMLNFKDRPNDYEDFKSSMAQNHGIKLLLSVPFLDTPSFVYLESDGTVFCQQVCYRSPLLWSFIGNAVDIGRTFDSFLKGLQGGHRDPPMSPKRHFGHVIVSYYIAIVLAILGYIIMAFFGSVLWGVPAFGH